MSTSACVGGHYIYAVFRLKRTSYLSSSSPLVRTYASLGATAMTGASQQQPTGQGSATNGSDASPTASLPPRINGDLNNTSVMRVIQPVVVDEAFTFKSLAIRESEDDAHVRKIYRPFLLDENITNSDWISRLDLAKATEMSHQAIQETGERLRILVLYGSQRARYV